MIITVGQYLDTFSIRSIPSTSAFCGDFTAGPERFLSTLETAVGIVRQSQAQVVRILKYQRAIASTVKADDFLHASFIIDPFAVAMKMLEQRDIIFLNAAVTFNLSSACLREPRLETIQRIENALAQNDLSCGIPNRIRTLIMALENRPVKIPVKKILLVEKTSEWRRLWRDLFLSLQKHGVDLEEQIDTENYTITAEPFLVEAGSLPEAADTTAAILEKLKSDNLSPVILAGPRTDVLDDALRRQSVAGCGYTNISCGNDAAEVLSLILLLQRKPVDPEIMQRYLSLVVTPLPSKVRLALLSVLQQCPGIGGAAWNGALEKCLSEAGEKESAYRDVVRQWLDTGRYSSGNPIATERALELCGMHIKWAMGRAAVDANNQLLLEHAASYGATLRDWLSIAPDGARTDAGLRRMIADASGACHVRIQQAPEQGSVRTVSHPSSFLAPIDVLVWWNASASSLPAVAGDFWNEKEKNELNLSGVEFISSDQDLRREQRQWRKMASLVNKRIIFVYAKGGGDLQEGPHPAWYDIVNLKKETEAQKLIFSAGSLRKGGCDALQVAIRNLPCITEAELKNEWNISHPVPQRETQSPTSLGSLVACPLKYAAEYGAKIRENDWPQISSGNTLFGNIAHAVILAYLENRKNREPDSIVIQQIFDEYVANEATLLLMPGYDSEREYLRSTIMNAGIRLHQILQDSGYRYFAHESALSCETEFGAFEGRVDLIVEKTDNSGKKAIVDLKWSGNSYQENSLKNGHSIQLAGYSTMLGDKTVTAYFIIKSALFLTVHKGLFDNSRIVQGLCEKDVWEQTVAWSKQRLSELSEGKIMVGTPDGMKDPADSKTKMLPADGAPFAPCNFCRYDFMCRMKEAV